MDFINAPLHPDVLPKAEEVSLHPAHPSYRKILVLEWWITTAFLVVIGAALIFFVTPPQNGFAWLLIVGAVLLLSAWHRISSLQSFKFLGYAVRERDVMVQKGWLIRSVKISPFNRIQNCSVQSGPLERRYGLASLIVYTAGSNGADLRISGLLQEEADRLRHFILRQIHAEPNENI